MRKHEVGIVRDSLKINGNLIKEVTSVVDLENGKVVHNAFEKQRYLQQINAELVEVILQNIISGPISLLDFALRMIDVVNEEMKKNKSYLDAYQQLQPKLEGEDGVFANKLLDAEIKRYDHYHWSPAVRNLSLEQTKAELDALKAPKHSIFGNAVRLPPLKLDEINRKHVLKAELNAELHKVSESELVTFPDLRLISKLNDIMSNRSLDADSDSESEYEYETVSDDEVRLSASVRDESDYEYITDEYETDSDSDEVEAFSSDNESSAVKSPSRESSTSSAGMFGVRRYRLANSPSISNSSSADNSRSSSLDGSEDYSRSFRG